MAVGVQSPRSNATQSEPDQQDDASLVLTVSDGSVHVKSEPCSENESFGPVRDEEDLFGIGEEATGDTPFSKSRLPVSYQGLPSLAQGTSKVAQTNFSPRLNNQTRACRWESQDVGLLSTREDTCGQKLETRFTWCTV